MRTESKIRRSRTVRGALALAACLLLAGSAARAQVSSYGDKQMGEPASDQLPTVLNRVNIVQKLNTRLPLDGEFRDEAGRTVRLGDYFGKRPAILALVYYNCPMLCSEEMDGLAGALEMVKFTPGKDFDVIVVSIDPSETPAIAAKKKAFYLKRYGRPETANGWHFLTGQQPAIDALANATGFGYVRVPGPDGKLTQFAHGSAIELITPDGRISQYYLGVEYSPKDLRLGLVEASEHKIGSPVDEIMTYCYHYDPLLNRHSLVIARIVQLGCIVTLLWLGGYMVMMFRRDVKATKAMPVPNWKNVIG
ncbi:MAG TPA: SCO family protein [Alloacidobacterium sp.]|jgi:protein SCO1/2|nr:SCO family protein [Alloacidobacterium sp.]